MSCQSANLLSRGVLPKSPLRSTLSQVNGIHSSHVPNENRCTSSHLQFPAHFHFIYTTSPAALADVYTELEKIAHMQFFSFRAFVSGLHSSYNGVGKSISLLTVEYVVQNAHAASYPLAWSGATVFFTTGSLEPCDDNSWLRNLSTKYVDGKLTWTHIHTANGSTFFSYWPLYTYNRHLKLITDCSIRISTRGSACSKFNPVIESLGQTLEGREIECISIGNGTLSAWIQHRQHPGEPMAEFFAEGLLHRLFGICEDGELDEGAKTLLHNYRLYIIPNMCPDGSVRGHLRTNSVGSNLNREWANSPSNDGYEAPTLERSPEVYAVLSKMDAIGCDFFLDVHGDEELPYVFFSGAEKTPVWGDRIMHLHGYFIASFQRVNADVQKLIGYPPPDSAEAAMKYMHVATNQVSNRFNCLGLTLEMPFKDCETNPDPDKGFGPERAKMLGSNLVDALNDVQSYLRSDEQFWDTFSVEDEYVTPTDNFKEDGFVMLKNRLYSDVRPSVIKSNSVLVDVDNKDP